MKTALTEAYNNGRTKGQLDVKENPSKYGITVITKALYTNATEIRSEAGTFSSDGVFYGQGIGDAHCDGEGTASLSDTKVEIYKKDGTLLWSWNTGYLSANWWNGTRGGSSSSKICVPVSKGDYWKVTYGGRGESGSGYAGAWLMGTFFN